jgi:hypothetical protein
MMSKKIMAWANWDVKEWDRLMILNRTQGMHILVRKMQMICLEIHIMGKAQANKFDFKYSSVQ